MSEKLKSCPLCGGEATLEGVWAVKYVLSNGWHVGCRKCQVSQEKCFGTKRQAIAAWNHRTPNIVHCRECKYITGTDKHVYGGSCSYNEMLVDPGDFCSYGKRREDAK